MNNFGDLEILLNYLLKSISKYHDFQYIFLETLHDK